jgi:hypothetical protein
MRLHGVDKIPQVIETLCLEAAETTEMIWLKTEEVRELAGAIQQIPKPQKSATKQPQRFPRLRPLGSK